MPEFLIRLIALLAALWLSPATAEEQFLPPEQAFRFSARMADASNVEIRFKISDQYYLYRERFAFKADGARLGTPVIPPGKIKFDETFEKDVEVYRREIVIRLPVTADAPFTLTVSSQGCADKGLCYPPTESVVKL